MSSANKKRCPTVGSALSNIDEIYSQKEHQPCANSGPGKGSRQGWTAETCYGILTCDCSDQHAHIPHLEGLTFTQLSCINKQAAMQVHRKLREYAARTTGGRAVCSAKP